jgi:hypothetical protein
MKNFLINIYSNEKNSIDESKKECNNHIENKIEKFGNIYTEENLDLFNKIFHSNPRIYKKVMNLYLFYIKYYLILEYF